MSFQKIIGHNSAKKILLGAFEHNRVAGTYLFSGPEGVGKRRVALSLAQLLNCENRTSDPLDACGECRPCKKIREGVHPDVFTVSPEKAVLKIEQIRQVLDVMALQPYEARHRVAIIDYADTMNDSAANAFLKTLEEPPANSHIILISSRPSALLPTILSRCQAVTFQPLSLPEVKEVLATEGTDPEQLDFLAALSEGRPGRALSLVGGEEEQNRREALSILGMVPWENTASVSAYAEVLAKEPVESVVSVLRWLHSFLRDLAVFEASGDNSLTTNTDLWYDIERFGDRFRGIYVLACLGMVHETLEGLRRNANRQLALEALFIKMSEPAHNPV
ncbi:MAG: DNA polymerase III subunit delta' [Nitrospirota bacterium]|nr:DNA polymerase III subunit delta' [Nitrospirota bacterium]